MTPNQHTGACACGAFHYVVKNEPLNVAVCHCGSCKKRTGSAFGIGCAFLHENVDVFGEYNTYERMSDAGRTVTHRFCPKCATTVMWTAEAFAKGIVIAGGTFDEPQWLTPKLHAWTAHKLPWFSVPKGLKAFEHSPG